MAKTHSIAPFPTSIDRDAFGHWLSGFADGESSFVLYAVSDASDGRRESLRAVFRLSLRVDDAEIIELIRSFWNCGTLTYHAASGPSVNGKPVISFSISGIKDLVTVVIPHFERHPLRSKKQRDFAIWKEGVALIPAVSTRPHPCTCVPWRQQAGISKWLIQER